MRANEGGGAAASESDASGAPAPAPAASGAPASSAGSGALVSAPLFGPKSILAIVACLAGYLGLWAAVEAADGGMLGIDAAAYQLFSLDLRSEGMTDFMQAVSLLAQPAPMVAMILVVLAFARPRRTALYCAGSAIGIHLVSSLLKRLVCRPRPEAALQVVAATGWSFPSGHIMNAIALFGLFAWFVWRSDRPRLERQLLCLMFGVVAALVGISRIYLGVHYASDVLAGACVALLWLVLYTRLVLAIERALAKRGRGGAGARAGGRGEGAPSRP